MPEQTDRPIDWQVRWDVVLEEFQEFQRLLAEAAGQPEWVESLYTAACESLITIMTKFMPKSTQAIFMNMIRNKCYTKADSRVTHRAANQDQQQDIPEANLGDQPMGPYESDIVELERRILALIPDHPEILNMTDVWDLFKIPGFRCNDIGPSMAQADATFSAAKLKYKKEHP